VLYEDTHNIEHDGEDDFDSLGLTEEDIGNIRKRKWLPTVNGKPMGKSKKWTARQRERMMSVLRTYSERCDDTLGWEPREHEGLRRRPKPVASAAPPRTIGSRPPRAVPTRMVTSGTPACGDAAAELSAAIARELEAAAFDSAGDDHAGAGVDTETTPADVAARAAVPPPPSQPPASSLPQPPRAAPSQPRAAKRALSPARPKPVPASPQSSRRHAAAPFKRPSLCNDVPQCECPVPRSGGLPQRCRDPVNLSCDNKACCKEHCFLMQKKQGRWACEEHGSVTPTAPPPLRSTSAMHD